MHYGKAQRILTAKSKGKPYVQVTLFEICNQPSEPNPGPSRAFARADSEAVFEADFGLGRLPPDWVVMDDFSRQALPDAAKVRE
jgi:hypothetical protein